LLVPGHAVHDTSYPKTAVG